MIAAQSSWAGAAYQGIQQKLGVLIPIDIPAIANSLGVDADTVFGRLYHHLDPKYAPEPASDGSRKVLFTPEPVTTSTA